MMNDVDLHQLRELKGVFWATQKRISYGIKTTHSYFVVTT